MSASALQSTQLFFGRSEIRILIKLMLVAMHACVRYMQAKKTPGTGNEQAKARHPTKQLSRKPQGRHRGNPNVRHVDLPRSIAGAQTAKDGDEKAVQASPALLAERRRTMVSLSQQVCVLVSLILD